MMNFNCSNMFHDFSIAYHFQNHSFRIKSTYDILTKYSFKSTTICLNIKFKIKTISFKKFMKRSFTQVFFCSDKIKTSITNPTMHFVKN